MNVYFVLNTIHAPSKSIKETCDTDTDTFEPEIKNPLFSMPMRCLLVFKLQIDSQRLKQPLFEYKALFH